MKNFKTILQNACEDYLTSLEHEPTLEDVATMCQQDVADVVWKAYSLALANRKTKAEMGKKNTKDPIINGMKQSKAQEYLTQYADVLLRKPVGNYINAIKHLFKMCDTYGFSFAYGTEEGTFDELKHNSEDKVLIEAYSILKK